MEQKNPNQLANAVLNLSRNKNLQKKLNKNAMKHIRDLYSWGIVADKFEKVYSKVK